MKKIIYSLVSLVLISCGSGLCLEENELNGASEENDGASPATITQIAAGQRHTCALLSAGNVRCWGYGDSGRLGYGNTNAIGDDETPSSAGDIDLL